MRRLAQKNNSLGPAAGSFVLSDLQTVMKKEGGKARPLGRWARVNSPTGEVAVMADAKEVAISLVNFFPASGRPPPECPAGEEVPSDQLPNHPVLAKAVGQLKEYFAGQRTAFDLPLELPGTEFQKSVWAALRTIPYGETTTYSDVANRIGRPSARRAVGAANGKNPVAICVPCHRVIGSNGQLVGYSGGLPHKQWLLEMEKENIEKLRAVKNKRKAKEQAEAEAEKEKEILDEIVDKKQKEKEGASERETEPKKRVKREASKKD